MKNNKWIDKSFLMDIDMRDKLSNIRKQEMIFNFIIIL